MLSIQEAFDELKATLHKKRVESHVQNVFDNLASYLVLLNSSSPSVQMLQNLCTVLRRPLLPLYNACFRPALHLSSTVLSTALGNADNVKDETLRAAWDATAEVILSGILDFLDQKDGPNIESDCVVWEVLYRVINEFFFPDRGRGLPAFSVPLCLSAYNTLTEVAARQVTIRNALRQKAVLGGERLGVTISRTRGNYLLLEALLTLFARLLPPTNNSPQGKLRRVKFVKEVLGSQKLFKCSSELLHIMQNTSGTHWDDVAAQIIDVLAGTDITYPQPFSIDEIHVCGHVFPQPLATDRLIMDKQAFLANIVAEDDDVCESLQVPYSHIRTITLDNSEGNVPKGKVLIVVYLTSSPLVANVETKSPDASLLFAKFMLQDNVVGRFMEALRRRGVGKLCFLNAFPKVERKRKNISIGSGIELINDSSPTPTASFEGKVQHVNQVYKTDVEDPDTFQAVQVAHFVDHLPTPDSKLPFTDENLFPEFPESAVAEGAPITLESTRLIQFTKETSQPLQNSASPFFPGHSTRTTKSFGGSDELSEISEFEVDSNTASGWATTGGCNHGSKPAQHKIDRIRMSKNSTITSKGIKESSDSASKMADCINTVSQRLPETGKLLPNLGSPTFRSSSSTKIDVSPKLLLNVDTLPTMIGTEAVNNVFIASQNFVPCKILSSTQDEPGQYPRPCSPSAGADQKTRSPVEIAKDTIVPCKTAGNRRKRESTKSSSKSIIEIDDAYTPPRKKRREDMIGIEVHKFKWNETLLEAIPISGTKKRAKTGKRSSVCIDPKTKDFGEPAELNSTCRGTRRSSRIKKRQIAGSGRTYPDVASCKTQKEKQPGGQYKSATVSPQANGTGIGHGSSSPLSSHLIAPVISMLPSPRVSIQVPLLELGDVVTPESRLPRGISKGNSILACAPSHPNATSGNEPRGGPAEAASAVKRIEEQLHVKNEVINDEHLVHDVHTVDKEAGRVRDVVESLVLLKECEDFAEPSQPNMESGTIAIDLTIDDSPARARSQRHKTPFDVRSEGDTQTTKTRIPDLSDSITTEEPPPRRRRRSVTFASPIEYVLEKKVKSKVQASSLSRQLPPLSESSTLSPLRTTTRVVHARRESPGRVISRVPLQGPTTFQASVQDRVADEVEIQDIVEVLNEIQAVIIKGISDKFQNVRKDVQHGRDELIQQVLGELRGMAVENAKYFNGLLRLEEDYYKNCKAIIHCWEELINCNDSIATEIQDALKEYDQNISAKAFPRSLLPMQPVFPHPRANP